jgi:hypothetical protein
MAVERPVDPGLSFSWRWFVERKILKEMPRVRVAVRWFRYFGDVELKMRQSEPASNLARAAILAGQLVVELRLQSA